MNMDEQVIIYYEPSSEQAQDLFFFWWICSDRLCFSSPQQKTWTLLYYHHSSPRLSFHRSHLKTATTYCNNFPFFHRQTSFSSVWYSNKMRVKFVSNEDWIDQFCHDLGEVAVDSKLQATMVLCRNEPKDSTKTEDRKY